MRHPNSLIWMIWPFPANPADKRRSRSRGKMWKFFSAHHDGATLKLAGCDDSPRTRGRLTHLGGDLYYYYSHFLDFRSPRNMVSRFIYLVRIFSLFSAVLSIKLYVMKKVIGNAGIELQSCSTKILWIFYRYPSVKKTPGFPRTCTPFSSDSVWRSVVFSRVEHRRGRCKDCSNIESISCIT